VPNKEPGGRLPWMVRYKKGRSARAQLYEKRKNSTGGFYSHFGDLIKGARHGRGRIYHLEEMPSPTGPFSGGFQPAN